MRLITCVYVYHVHACDITQKHVRVCMCLCICTYLNVHIRTYVRMYLHKYIHI